MHQPAFILIFVSLVLTGCSTINIIKGDDDFYRNHYAEVLKDSIDEAVQKEARRETPNGYKRGPYSRKQWQEYWKSRIHHIGRDDDPPAYKGPSGQEWIQYIHRKRREAGLPPLSLAPELRSIRSP